MNGVLQERQIVQREQAPAHTHTHCRSGRLWNVSRHCRSIQSKPTLCPRLSQSSPKTSLALCCRFNHLSPGPRSLVAWPPSCSPSRHSLSVNLCLHTCMHLRISTQAHTHTCVLSICVYTLACIYVLVHRHTPTRVCCQSVSTHLHASTY